jgi:hypothetical protein
LAGGSKAIARPALRLGAVLSTERFLPEMNPAINSWMFAGVLFVGMLVLLEVGRRVGVRHVARDPEGARYGLGIIEGAVFSMLGLLIAFTFSGAATRFDARRQLVVEEANDIGTAWLRLDLLPAVEAGGLRELFRQYLDSRIETYRKLPDIAAATAELARSVKLQGEIWASAVAAGRESGSQPAQVLLLPALNQMFDITTTRTETTKIHPPTIIFAMLGVLSLGASVLAGYGMAGGKARRWTHMIAFAAVTAITVYVIMDLEYPRLGLIRVDTADQVLIQLREGMKQATK